MKIVLDSNVVISAFASRGLCDAILEFCIEEQEVVLSEHLIREIRSGFLKKLKMPKSEAEDNLGFLLGGCLLGDPHIVPRESCRDPKDLPVLGLAVAVGADFIVTGDTDLLELVSFHRTRILSPRDFWEFLKKSGKPKNP